MGGQLARIGVDKSASHHLSQNEIAGDNPCSRQLSGLECDPPSQTPKGSHLLLLSLRHQYHLRVTDSHRHRSALHCKLDPDGGSARRIKCTITDMNEWTAH